MSRAVRVRWEAVRARGAGGRQQRHASGSTARLCCESARLPPASSAELDAWLANLYSGDVRTLEHACRVSNLSVLVARQLGITASLLGHIRRAALLHEVGNLDIPPSMIGPLSAGERAAVRESVQGGYAIALASPFLRPCAEIVLSVRERFDGNGDPRRLKGDLIPVGARILTVVDFFDSLTSASVSSESVSECVANAELVRGAGSRFDPQVVRAWLRCVDRLATSGALVDVRDQHDEDDREGERP